MYHYATFFLTILFPAWSHCYYSGSSGEQHSSANQNIGRANCTRLSINGSDVEDPGRSIFLWTVDSKELQVQSYLFGTIHVGYDQVWDYGRRLYYFPKDKFPESVSHS